MMDDHRNDVERLCDKCALYSVKCVFSAIRGCPVLDSSHSVKVFHLSPLEHVCGDCYAFIKDSDEYKVFQREWTKVSRTEPSVTLYLVSEVIPYWLKCKRCCQWREFHYRFSLFPPDFDAFECANAGVITGGDPCLIAEDDRVDILRQTPKMVSEMMHKPLLHNFPGMNLLDKQNLEAVGVYPILTSECNMLPQMSPFCKSLRGNLAVYVNPNKMLDDIEKELNTETFDDVPTFLGLRNLIVSLYYYTGDQCYTIEKVSRYVCCRGLVRVHLYWIIEDYFNFLTQRGAINYGCPARREMSMITSAPEVIIIGSGIAGLVAAKHFHNMGITYVVLEASKRAGGRIWDEDFFYKGAQALNVFKNMCNPLIIMCHSVNDDTKMLSIPSDPRIINLSTKSTVPTECVHSMACQLKGTLKAAVQLAQKGSIKNLDFGGILLKKLLPKGDYPLASIIKDYRKVYCHELGFMHKTNNKDTAVFDLLLRLYEISTRTNVVEHSLKHFVLPRAYEEDLHVIGGLNRFINTLKKEVNINYNTKVEAIEYGSKKDIQVNWRGGSMAAQKVLITVPIPILRSKIVFNPELPKAKMETLRKLGDIRFEKVILNFKVKFWDKQNDRRRKHAIISENPDEHLGPFTIFVDITETMINKMPTLVTFITKSNEDEVKGKTDAEIVLLCSRALKKVFPDAVKPSSYCVTHWSEDPNFLTSGTFQKQGSSIKAFEVVAEPIAEKLFFAGEGTSRDMPNTLLGAALSGLRDAVKITDLLRPFKVS